MRLFNIYLLLLALFPFCSALHGQNFIDYSTMDSSEVWNIYHMGSADTAHYEFNYTGDSLAYGEDGCLRVTSDKGTNILFWQKLTIEGGKSYKLDGAVKTGYVESFWCELYLSTVEPVEDEDYSPNDNNDVVLGLSTWAGCGPNLDGLFSEVACVNRLPYQSPGEYGEDVEVYFGIKTGIWDDMDTIEVLLDEFSLELVEDWFLTGTAHGELNQDSLEITQVPPLITVEEFKTGLEAPLTASVEIIGRNSKQTIQGQDTTIMADTMKVRVTGNQIIDYDIQIRPISNKNNILYALGGDIDTVEQTVTNLPSNARIIQLKSAITVSPYANFTLVDGNDDEPPAHDTISPDIRVIVTAENGDEKIFSLQTGDNTIPEVFISDSTATRIDTIKNQILYLEGNIDWTITSANNPLQGSLLNFQSDDIWLYFGNIRPNDFITHYLDHVLVNDAAAVNNENIRVVQYLQGTMVISHDNSYKPMHIYSDEDLSGNSMELGTYTYHRSEELGGMHDSIRSFTLKKGYMATLARNEDGTGYSRVYIADEKDLVIDSVPYGLYDEVSFIRVFPWRWAHKKGFCGSKDGADALNSSWHYDWGAGTESDPNVEFIPMRHNAGWDAYSKINSKQNTTHVLGFNEPDRPDQADMTVQQALDQWPRLLESGLRLGSPAPSDGGLDWLFTFIEECDKRNYRVDFVAMHWYMGGQTAQQFYDRLKMVHDETKRPIWITEWNNGANWTCCTPTYAEQAKTIESFLHMLDTTSFVERYSLYEWVEETRHMFYEWATVFTPAGEVYRDKKSPMAFNRDKEYFLPYSDMAGRASSPVPGNQEAVISPDVILRWTAGENAESHRIYMGTSPSNLTFRGEQMDTTYIPTFLEPGNSYYWRIDEVYEGKITPGNTWQFSTIEAEEPTTVQEQSSLRQIQVYPQPAANILHIEGLQNTTEMDMFDLTGVKVLSGTTKGSLDIGHLAKGIYILKIKGYEPVKVIKSME